MTLKKLLQLQLLYYGLGMAFNAVSIYIISTGGQALTPNEPVAGSMAMTLYASFLIPGFLKKIPFYRVLMGLAVVLLGYGGVLKHFYFLRTSPELYYSFLAGVIGMSINIFGLLLNCLAAFGKFTSAE